MQPTSSASCLPDGVLQEAIKNVKRSTSAADWKFEIALPEYTKTIKAEIYAAMQGECTSLLVCVEERKRLTLPLGVVVSDLSPLRAHSETKIADCHLLSRFKLQMTKESAQQLVRLTLSPQLVVKSAEPICDWFKAIEEASRTDLDAAMKDIDEALLDWRSRLWMKIVFDGVRTIRSSDTIFRELGSQHVAFKSVFNDLLNRYHQQKNAVSTRRLIYSDCINPMSIDGEIICNAGWARSVLDWFAERLVPVDMNRRTLYLWGGAGVGKTRLIERLLEAQMCVRRDCAEVFFLQGLTEDHRFVWLDEFVPSIIVKNKEYRQQFNKLTGRERVMVRVKGGEQYEVDADTVRTIITSNDPPPTAEYFLRRFFAVKAAEAIYGSQCVRMSRKRLAVRPRCSVTYQNGLTTCAPARKKAKSSPSCSDDD
jgi:hypothetical protein